MIVVPPTLRALLPGFDFDELQVSGSRVFRTTGSAAPASTMVRLRGDFADTVARVGASLGAAPGPVVGNRTFRTQQFDRADRSVMVGVEGAFVEITDFPRAPSSPSEVVEVVAGHAWLAGALDRMRDAESLTACALLASGWLPNVYVEAAGLPGPLVAALMREVGEGSAEWVDSADGTRFASFHEGQLRLGLTPGPL